MIIPDLDFKIKGVNFCYNGSYASMFALKAFTALFPTVVAKDCQLVYVRENGQEEIPDINLVKDYLNVYGKEINTTILTGQPNTALAKHLAKMHDHIAVFGAYGRSRISRFFNNSSTENLLGDLRCPIFITHPDK